MSLSLSCIFRVILIDVHEEQRRKCTNKGSFDELNNRFTKLTHDRSHD